MTCMARPLKAARSTMMWAAWAARHTAMSRHAAASGIAILMGAWARTAIVTVANTASSHMALA